MRKAKLVGLALMAISAMSAISAQAASAVSWHAFEVGTAVNYNNTVFLHGTSTGTHTFTAGATVKCTTATGTARVAGSTWSSVPTSLISYSGCTVAGQAATVNMNECTFEFGEPSGTGPTYSIKTIKVVCPTGKEIVVTATTAGCTIKVGPQEFKETTTTAENFTEGGVKKVKVSGSVSKKIKYTGSGGICGGSGTEGSYSGVFDVSGFKNVGLTEPLDIEVF